MNATHKDLRLSAINDLLVELQRHTINLDNYFESRLVRTLTSRLGDRFEEVQNASLKW